VSTEAAALIGEPARSFAPLWARPNGETQSIAIIETRIPFLIAAPLAVIRGIRGLRAEPISQAEMADRVQPPIPSLLINESVMMNSRCAGITGKTGE
jgi:hypothetical protein